MIVSITAGPDGERLARCLAAIERAAGDDRSVRHTSRKRNADAFGATCELRHLAVGENRIRTEELPAISASVVTPIEADLRNRRVLDFTVGTAEDEPVGNALADVQPDDAVVGLREAVRVQRHRVENADAGIKSRDRSVLDGDVALIFRGDGDRRVTRTANADDAVAIEIDGGAGRGMDRRAVRYASSKCRPSACRFH